MTKKKSLEKSEKRIKVVNIFVLVAILIGTMLVLTTNVVVAIEPQGANTSGETTTTAPDTQPESHDAHAGNVTEMDVAGKFYTTGVKIIQQAKFMLLTIPHKLIGGIFLVLI